VSVEKAPFLHASEFVPSLVTVVIMGILTDGYIKSHVLDTVVRVVAIKGSLVGDASTPTRR
jgi:hypothetical protein